MNKNTKNELMFLMGVGALTSLLFKRKKLALGLTVATGAVALSKGLKQSNRLKSFNEKVALITGGSRGLGLALAKKLAAQGAKLSLLARDQEELEQAKKILMGITSEQKILILQCDITNQQQLSEVFRKTLENFGHIDLLINNAGAIIVGPFASMTLADYEAQMKLHVYANINATHEILPIFRKQGGGRIVNICSMGGKVAVPHMLPYDTSKFALAGFSQGITAELSRENISVTTVYPALMRTGSPIQAVFKGNAEKEFSWFANADVFPGFSSAADVVAEKIIQASLDRRAELIPSLIGKARTIMGVFFPELMLYAMGIMNRLMPKSHSLIYKTGAESRTKKSYLFKSLQKSAEQAQLELNQHEKSNAAFNLGLH